MTGSNLDAEDILNVTYSYKNNFEQLKELRVDNYKFYLLMMKGIKIQEIFKLNSILLSNEIIDKMKIIRLNFSDEESFREYNDSVLTTELFRYKILRDTGIDKSVAIARIKEEINEQLNNKISTIDSPKIKIKK